jgi:PAS domain S-box-containing protein
MNWQNLRLWSITHFWRYFAVVGVLSVVYFGAAKIAFSALHLDVEASPLWPPAGIALAALLLQGRRVCPGVVLGSFFFARSLGVSSVSACGLALGSTLQALVGAELLRRMNFRASLERLQDVFQLLIFGAWSSPIVNATISTLVGYLSGSVDPDHWQENWWVLWLGDGMGILVLTPLLLIGRRWIADFRLLKKGLKVRKLKLGISKLKPSNFNVQLLFNRRVETAICFTLLFVISWVVFGSKTTLGIAQYPVEYLPFPLVVWAALRFGQLGAVVATLLVCLIAIWGVVQEVGPLVAKAGDIYQAILFLHGFMGVLTITALVLAAAEAERISAVDSLKEQEASLANAQRLAQLGNWDFYEIRQGKSVLQKQLHWSDELYRLFGFVPKAFEPSWETFFQVVHPADRDRVGQAIRGALRENRPYCLDYRIVRPDGSERVVYEQSEINSHGISGTVQDVTDRKQVEMQLRAAAERERLLGEMALRIRRSLDLDQILNTTVAEVRQFLGADRVFIGQISDVSRELNTGEELKGWQVGKLQGSQELGNSKQPSNLPYPSAPLAPGFGNGYPEYFTNAERERLSYPSATPTGNGHTHREHPMGNELSSAAQPTQFPYPSRTANPSSGDARSSYLAQGAVPLTRMPNGFSEPVQISTSLQGLVIAESVDPCYPSLRSMIVDDEVALQEWRSLFKQGNVRVIEDTNLTPVPSHIATYHSQHRIRAILGVPIWLGDELYGALVVNQCDQPRQWQSWEIDWLTSLATQVAIAIQQAELYRQITDLNTHLESQVEERTQELSAKMTELQELNQLKDVFLQAVSHDLRTSLLGMSMVLNNLYQSPGETVTLSRPLLKRMMASSERQLILISSLLEDHFNEERELDLHCQPLQLDQLIQDLLADYSPMLAQNRANLTQSLPNHFPLITADPTQLRRVLENLLTNALKHNPPGLNLRLQVTVENQMIRCTLQDDGVGMSEHQQNSLFKLYIRGLHTEHLTGIGLGLYQCRQIITAHGGQIGVNSVLGDGSMFWFTLPLTVPNVLDCNRCC